MIYRKKYENINILVIGDSCVDKFTYGSVHRLCPEAPVPIFNPLHTIENEGMAGNVHRNIMAIGGNSKLITNDEMIIKTRLVDDRSGQILIRIDENDVVKRIEKSLMKSIVNNYFENVFYDAIIISDYNKGFLCEEDILEITTNNNNVFVDTKKVLDVWCANASFIKINHVEFEHTKYNLKNLDLEKKLIITLSKEGCRYMDTIFPVENVKIKDVSGAGDTFISGLVLEYVSSKDIKNSINFAQSCATIVVQKKGVCTI